MDWAYPTKYSDRRGIEKAALHNDGANLSVQLRGVRFSGRSFDLLEAESNCAADSQRNFTLWRGCLCDCTLECEIPIPLFSDGKALTGMLRMQLELGAP